MLKVVWVSRHEMSAEQKADLCRLMKVDDGEEVSITTENITWAASEDAELDMARNHKIWRALELKGDVIAGVFPPVAMEVRQYGVHFAGTTVLSPVSRQAPELRVGDGPIPFKHVRWAKI